MSGLALRLADGCPAVDGYAAATVVGKGVVCPQDDRDAIGFNSSPSPPSKFEELERLPSCPMERKAKTYAYGSVRCLV